MEKQARNILIRQNINSIIKEVFRKSIHLVSAIIPFLLKLAHTQIIILLILAMVGYSLAEFLRLSGHQIPLVSKITETAARKRDENKFVLGPVTLVLGIVISAILFPEKNATIGIYALSFGDGLASLSGKLFGRVHIPFTHGKTAAGSIVCFTAVFISSFFVCQNTFAALTLALTAMLIEILPLGDWDNLFIPICISAISQFLI